MVVEPVLLGVGLRQDDGGVAPGRDRHLRQHPEIPVVPILLQLLIQQLEGQGIPFGVLHLDLPHIAGPIPHGQLHHLGAGLGQGVEHVEDTGAAAAPLRAGHAHEILQAVAGAGTFRLGVVGVDVNGDGGGVDVLRDDPQGVLGLGAGRGHGGLVQAHGVLPGVLHTGAGDDIVEMGEQHILPGLPEGALPELEGGQAIGQGGVALRVAEGGLQTAVAPLDAALGGVAAGGEVLQLVVDHGQLLPHGLGSLEEFQQGAELDLGVDRPGHHIQGPLHVPAGGAAAVVAYAVDDQAGLQAAAAAGQIDEAGANVGRNGTVVPVGLPVGQHLPAGGGAVAVQHVVPVQGAAVVEVLHIAEAVDLRHVAVVAEGVGREVDGEILHAPLLAQVLPGVLDMPQQGLGVGHVFVRLHPAAGGHFPAPLGDAGLDALHQLWVVLLHDLVHAGLGLGEAEVRVLVHQVQHGAEGGQGSRHRLVEAPHPVHVDMGVGRQDQLVLLGILPHGGQHLLRLGAVGLGQGAVLFYRGQQVLQHLVQKAVILLLLRAGKPHGEFQLAEEPGGLPVGRSQVVLLLHRHTEGILEAGLFPVASQGALQAGEFRCQIAHAITSSLKIISDETKF